MGIFAPLERLGQRIFSIIILPAALPGDPAELTSELMAEPLATVRSWSPATVWALLRQLVQAKKLTIPDDPTLHQLQHARSKFTDPPSQKAWTHCTLTTADGVALDACFKPPADRQIPPRYILFLGGNSQKYEGWLPYFDMYANESELGFLCFNFRGVSDSGGAVTCLDDMLADVRAAFDFLVEERGALPHHILLHGFSIGGAIAAAFLAQPGAPRAALTSDRSFSSFCHAAFSLVRGFDAALGERQRHGQTYRAVAEDEEDGDMDEEVAGSGPAIDGVGKSWLRKAATGAISLARASAAQIAVAWARATGWELDTVAAWPKIEGRKIIIFNAADNIISYHAASLHAALERASHPDAAGLSLGSGASSSGSGKESPDESVPPSAQSQSAERDLLAGVTVVEMEIRHAQGWAMHDCPLTMDPDAWYAMINAERAALGLGRAS